MQVSDFPRIGLVLGAAVIAVFCLCAQDQSTPSKEAPKEEPPKDARTLGAVGLSPRASPTDYQASAKVGNFTIAGDFVQHSVPTREQLLTTEDFVTVEVAMYGPADAHLQISRDDFTLRINNKQKNILHAQSFVVVLSSIKDPEWVAPEEKEAKKSSTSIGTGGNDGGNLPPVIHVPIELQRAMALHTQKASLPEGDRALPQAGLIFFQYRGKVEKINAVDLLYNGPAGKAMLELQP
ncbi:MAG TPA: hypothetical protein VML19_05325 [Verrucomicrobiae bacterium]|nr:hypothetical protein [Verrucomicrobiae bacterium]